MDMQTNQQANDDATIAGNDQNSRRANEDFNFVTEKKSQRTKDENKIEDERTEDNLDSLDDVVKVGLTLATLAFFGINLSNFESVDGRDECTVGPHVIKMILKIGGSAFILLTLSAFSAIGTKFLVKKLKQKNNVEMKNIAFMVGKSISIGLVATGIIMLARYFGYVYELKFGEKDCSAFATEMDNTFLSWGVLGGAVLLFSALYDIYM